MKKEQPPRRRVLARFLAEDLRNLEAVRGAGATTTVTELAGGKKDITNVGSDGDSD